jgi:3-hydroxyisobutyrate dehydrogenase-like beta-hydroxyacid dehydrogenase
VGELAKLAQTLLTFARFALLKEALFLVESVSVEVSEAGVRLTRSYDKDSLVQFLQRYLSGTLPVSPPGTESRSARPLVR